MGKSLTKSERKSRKSGVGAFFGGTFVGFLLGLAAIAGICVFAYFKVSPEWLNKTFKTDINLGSEQANKVTLSDVVSSAMSILSNTSTYTLNDLNKDLGVEVPDKLLGIDNIAEKKKEARPDTLRSYSSYVSLLNNWVGRFNKELFCSMFNHTLAIKFMDYAYNERNVSARTYNNYLKMSRCFFEWAVEKGYCKENPFLRIKMKKKTTKERTIIDVTNRR